MVVIKMWILNLVTVCTKIAKYILKKNRTFLIIWGASRFKTGFIKKKKLSSMCSVTRACGFSIPSPSCTTVAHLVRKYQKLANDHKGYGSAAIPAPNKYQNLPFLFIALVSATVVLVIESP